MFGIYATETFWNKLTLFCKLGHFSALLEIVFSNKMVQLAEKIELIQSNIVLKAPVFLSKQAPHQCRLLSLPTNISIGWEGLPGTNTLAYYEHSQIRTLKSFLTLGSANIEKCTNNFLHHFYCVLFFVKHYRQTSESKS